MNDIEMRESSEFENYNALKKCVLADFPYFLEWDDTILTQYFSEIYKVVITEHSKIRNPYYSENGIGLIRLNFLDHYVILTYRFANCLYKNNLLDVAEAIYYSMRVRGSIDLYFTTEIGSYFIPTHSLGAVVDSHAKYGCLLKLYNGVHIGPQDIIGKPPSEWEHPVIGDYVTLLANSHVYGRSVIGNNVIVSSGTVIINDEIPDNCIVFGTSPNLYFMPLRNKNSSLLAL